MAYCKSSRFEGDAVGVLAIVPWSESFHGACVITGIATDTLGTEPKMLKAWMAMAWAKPLSPWGVIDSVEFAQEKDQ